MKRKYDVLSHPRQDEYGRINFMVAERGYCMVRRPGEIPFVKSVNDWIAMPLYNSEPRDSEAK